MILSLRVFEDILSFIYFTNDRLIFQDKRETN